MVVVLEYIWLGGNNELRSKIRVIENFKDNYPRNVCEIPSWNYDGSSTEQAKGIDSEIIIQPRALFINPLRNNKQNTCNNFLVLCDTYSPDNFPLSNNNRIWAEETFKKAHYEEPWFGLEQEYFMIDPKTNKPLGFPTDPDAIQGQYYCSVGAKNAFGRNIVEEHLDACLSIGIKISGVNAEVAPGQWEFQIGPCEGITAGDHLWVARYLLIRIAEKYDVEINLEPKPIKGNWNGSGCHTNYSTKNMREGTKNKTGLNYIDEAIEKLSTKHAEHMKVYGKNNEERMTGEHETASFDKFTEGIANRGASIRRGNETFKNKKGYFEDRRPSSNCDPYLVTAIIFKTTALSEQTKPTE